VTIWHGPSGQLVDLPGSEVVDYLLGATPKLDDQPATIAVTVVQRDGNRRTQHYFVPQSAVDTVYQNYKAAVAEMHHRSNTVYKLEIDRENDATETWLSAPETMVNQFRAASLSKEKESQEKNFVRIDTRQLGDKSRSRFTECHWQRSSRFAPLTVSASRTGSVLVPRAALCAVSARKNNVEQ